MKLRYLRAFIVLLAGLIALIINMKTHKNINVSLFIVLIVILVFYIIATLIVEILQRSLTSNDKDEVEIVTSSEEEVDEATQIPFDEE